MCACLDLISAPRMHGVMIFAIGDTQKLLVVALLVSVFTISLRKLFDEKRFSIIMIIERCSLCNIDNHENIFYPVKCAIRVPTAIVYQQSKYICLQVGPVVGFMENEINQQSYSIVHRHASAWPNERILQQVNILLLPVEKVNETCRNQFVS